MDETLIPSHSRELSVIQKQWKTESVTPDVRTNTDTKDDWLCKEAGVDMENLKMLSLTMLLHTGQTGAGVIGKST